MYKRDSQGLMKHLDFLMLDLICLHISYFAAYVLRHGWSNPYAVSTYRSMAIVISFIEIVIIAFFGTFKNVLKRGFYREFAVTVKHALLVVFTASFYLFSIQAGAQYSRLTLYYMGIIYCILSYAVRLWWKKVLQKKMQKSGDRSLLIVTVDDMVDTVISNIRSNNYEMFHIAGVAVVNRNLVGAHFDGIPVVANKDTVVDYACREWVDEVFFNFLEKEAYPQDLIDKFTEMGIVVHIKLFKETAGCESKRFVEKLGSYTVLTTSLNYATSLQLFFKRSMDILGGLAGCLITLLLVLIIGPVIYAQSPGPIFFSQVRVGRNGRKFKMYKFRSMYLDAEERKKELMEQNRVKDGMMFKLDWDPRIIGSKKLPDGTVKKGIGNYIRDWSLDEFPQFFNILKGDMSLVGTRPPTVDEWEKYEPHHRSRLAIRPGLTGMWQVSGRSNITDFEEVVKLDRQYICGWSMGLDFRILFKTVGAVLNKDGSM